MTGDHEVRVDPVLDDGTGDPTSAETQYWAVLWDGDDISQPRTLVRRRPSAEGPVEEIFGGQGVWRPTGVLALHRLHMGEHELSPLSRDAALAFEQARLDGLLPRTRDGSGADRGEGGARA
jgi:hypothetical protein